ncbi:hypothetical protein BN7_3200 [Wickerhamomyces ciferrii]|uniref:Uncharacterized protein n=1 Tax=Wickerhamomyces ciferrii (strain ATCC 14091 / BCRC 22168 / CBS 111 / JCM 3599 / NBRC 0793 / NRRL Y-1031 F-60-10) TaxID=1206466 RepID=K0KN69_WICCF|nr:uncharacterized protein BN7_3200 [Wickerhamomyces ciferrii]CCH43647.1 hypothetical protein BN7_3200 [Wickerhamomyces ciferrii]
MYKFVFSIEVATKFESLGYVHDVKLKKSQLKYQNQSRKTHYSNTEPFISNDVFKANCDALEHFLQTKMEGMTDYEVYSSTKRFIDGIHNDLSIIKNENSRVPFKEVNFRTMFNQQLIKPISRFFSEIIAKRCDGLVQPCFSSLEEKSIHVKRFGLSKSIFKKLKSSVWERMKNTNMKYQGLKDLSITYEGPLKVSDDKISIEFKNIISNIDILKPYTRDVILGQVNLYMFNGRRNNYILSNFEQSWYIEISNDQPETSIVRVGNGSKLNNQDLYLNNKVKVLPIGLRARSNDEGMKTQLFLAIRMFDLFGRSLEKDYTSGFEGYYSFSFQNQADRKNWIKIQDQIIYSKFGSKLSGSIVPLDSDGDKEPPYKKSKIIDEKDKPGIGGEVYDSDDVVSSFVNTSWDQLFISSYDCIDHYKTTKASGIFKLTCGVKEFKESIQTAEVLMDERCQKHSQVLVEGYDLFQEYNYWFMKVSPFEELKVAPNHGQINKNVKTIIKNHQQKLKILDIIQAYNSKNKSGKIIRIPPVLKYGYGMTIINDEYKHLGPYIAFQIPNSDILRYKPFEKNQVDDLRSQIEKLHELKIHHNKLCAKSLYCIDDKSYIMDFNDATLFSDCDKKTCEDYKFLNELSRIVDILNH